MMFLQDQSTARFQVDHCTGIYNSEGWRESCAVVVELLAWALERTCLSLGASRLEQQRERKQGCPGSAKGGRAAQAQAGLPWVRASSEQQGFETIGS